MGKKMPCWWLGVLGGFCVLLALLMGWAPPPPIVYGASEPSPSLVPRTDAAAAALSAVLSDPPFGEPLPLGPMLDLGRPHPPARWANVPSFSVEGPVPKSRPFPPTLNQRQAAWWNRQTDNQVEPLGARQRWAQSLLADYRLRPDPYLRILNPAPVRSLVQGG